MSQQIERKFVIRENGSDHTTPSFFAHFSDVDVARYHTLTNGTRIRQGYLPVALGLEISEGLGIDCSFDPDEARLRDQGGMFSLTLKEGNGIARQQVASELDGVVFEAYWPYTTEKIEKVRLNLPTEGLETKIDVFMDRDLILAEILAPSEAAVAEIDPLGGEVTDDPSYQNHELAMSDFHRKFIVTGGPGVGKTTTLEHIKTLQYHVVPESARYVFQTYETAEKARRHLLEVQLDILRKSQKTEAELANWGTIFLDRGIPDGLVFCAEYGLEPPTPLVDAVRRHNYQNVFLLEPVPEYRNDKHRPQTPEESARLHQNLRLMYGRLGFTPMVIPSFEGDVAASVRKRAELMIQHSYRK